MSDKIRNFFAGIPGEQGPETPPLLPVNEKDGAPTESLYLLQFVEDGVEVRHSGENSRHPGHPYINYKVEVVAPDDYAGRPIYGMFYFPAPLEEDIDPESKQAKDHSRQTAQFVGALDEILGEGTLGELQGGTLEDTLTGLVDMLEGEVFVGKVGVQAARKEDGVVVYPARNRITYFHNKTTWQGEAS